MRKILYIAKNIPIPGYYENPIILRIGGSLKKFNTTYIYPKEYFLGIFRLFNSKNEKGKSLVSLKNKFKILNKDVYIIKYIRLPSLRLSFIFSNIFQYKLANEIIHLKGIELIHSHFTLPDGEIGRVLSSKWKIPHVVSFRDGDLRKIEQLPRNTKQKLKYLNVLKSATGIICHNHATAEWLNSKKDFSGKVIRIPHGIEDVKTNINFEDKSNVILYTGNLNENKRVEWLIIAFLSLPKHINWDLRIIGDGPKKQSLIDLAQKDNRIKFLGRLTQPMVYEEMKKAKVFVMTSQNETFGLVYLEAALHKCAVIGTKNKGIYGWFKENEHALFIETVDELTERLLELIDNPILCKALGNKVYKHTKQNFIWDQVIQRYDNLYSSLII